MSSIPSSDTGDKSSCAELPLRHGCTIIVCMNHQGSRALTQLTLCIGIVLWLASNIALRPAQGQASQLGYGTNAASTTGMLKTAEMGFQWVRVYYPEQAAEAEQYGLKALLLIGWEYALTDVQTWGDSVYDLVSRYRGRISAYQICNEPNLAEMWHQSKYAEPVEYVAYLREAYLRAKQADPNCIIVTAGMAVNGGAGDRAMDDVAFFRGMYEAGAKPYFDVLASHPYGFAYEPEDATSNPIHCFRRVEQVRQVMLEYGDGAKPIWATEFGWIIDPGEGCQNYDGWPGRWWQRVPAQTQADYLYRAFQYARTNWPWMGVMFVWNMDYDLVPWNDYCDQKSWFALLNHDGSPRPSYWTLARMVQGTPTATPTATRAPEATATPWPSATMAMGVGSVTGRVVMQGRSNHTGALVSISEETATTLEDGSFRIDDIPSGSHELNVYMAGYIPYRQAGLVIDPERIVNVSDIQMRAGDVNGDGAVDLFDLVAISTRYGSQIPAGTAEDVNGDGQVTLLDLVLVSSNYGAGH
jgi:hypothetical protein